MDWKVQDQMHGRKVSKAAPSTQPTPWTRQCAWAVVGIAFYSTVWLVVLNRFVSSMPPIVPARRTFFQAARVSTVEGQGVLPDHTTSPSPATFLAIQDDSYVANATETTESTVGYTSIFVAESDQTASEKHDAGLKPSTIDIGHDGGQPREVPTQLPPRADESPLSPPIIPKIIHQSWKSADHIPSKFVPWMQSWRHHHSTWDYMFWDDADNLHLFEAHYTKYAPVAREVGKIHLADMTRYALLHRYGGLYVDGDFESLSPFDDLLHLPLFLSYEPLVHSVLLEGASAPVLCNAILASAPGHPFWLAVLDNIWDAFHGPGGANQDPAASNISDIALLDEEYFYPEVAYWNFDNLSRKCTQIKSQPSIVQEACAWLTQYPTGRYTNNTHAVHHWQCTWCRGDDTASYVTLQDIFPGQDIRRPQ